MLTLPSVLSARGPPRYSPPPRPASIQATVWSCGLNLGIAPHAYTADAFCTSIEAQLCNEGGGSGGMSKQCPMLIF